MNLQLQPHLTTAKRQLPFESVALLLQGGGALGAYQGGVYEALAEADIHPNWIAGISIGAINAAIIAGNPPNSRVDRLREFWTQVTSSAPWDWSGNSFVDLARSDDARNLLNQMSAGQADRGATSRLGSESYRSSTRAEARTGSAISANKVTAICAAYSWPARLLSSGTPRSMAPNIGPGSRPCWRGGRPRLPQ
jgi:predicted acylesterase/phospholipase RssA